jgi:hypothetical protein
MLVRTPLILALALAVACGGDQPAKDSASVQFSPESREPSALAGNDVKITSTDGALVLSVIQDSVTIQLSDSLRASVKDDVREETSKISGAGAIIGNAVSAAVNTAMGFTVRVPARGVKNLRYENGDLRFDLENSIVTVNGSDAKRSGSSNGGPFTPEDAQRFIDAVKAAQSR